MVDEGVKVVTDVFDRYTREGMRLITSNVIRFFSRGLSIYAAYDAWLGSWHQPQAVLKLVKQSTGDTASTIDYGRCWGAIAFADNTLAIELDSEVM